MGGMRLSITLIYNDTYLLDFEGEKSLVQPQILANSKSHHYGKHVFAGVAQGYAKQLVKLNYNSNCANNLLLRQQTNRVARTWLVCVNSERRSLKLTTKLNS